MEVTFKIFGIALGIILAAWGVFHQLIVGGAAATIKHPEESEARLFVMSWVAQGGFMTLLGILPATMLFFYGISPAPVHTVLVLCALALILLSSHVVLTGLSTHLRPIQIGAILEMTYGLFLVLLLIIS